MSAQIKHRSASVTLRPTIENTVWISNLYSEDRMKGHATELMQKIVNKADEEGVTLQLDARAYGHPYGLSSGALIVFYEGFGFIHIQGSSKYLMERKPVPLAVKTDPIMNH